MVSSTRYQREHIPDFLTCSVKTVSLPKQAQQRMYFLDKLRRTHLPPSHPHNILRKAPEYSANCFSVKNGGSGASVCETVRVGLSSLHWGHCTEALPVLSRNIIRNLSHLHHRLLSLMDPGKRFCSIWCRTTRLNKSFFFLDLQTAERFIWIIYSLTIVHTHTHVLHPHTAEIGSSALTDPERENSKEKSKKTNKHMNTFLYYVLNYILLTVPDNLILCTLIV